VETQTWDTIGMVHPIVDTDDALSFINRLSNETHTPAPASASYSATITCLQNPACLAKSFMVNAIKDHLTQLLGAPPFKAKELKF